MKVLIIGASGFLGQTMYKLLQSLGHTVYGTSTKAVNGLIEYNAMTDDLLIEEGTDVVFYLAQSDHYRSFPENYDHLLRVNSIVPVNLAKQAAEKKVKFFCYASTGNVYKPSFENLKESSPLEQASPYALSKYTAEKALSFLNSDTQIMCVRLFGLFGPGQKTMLPQVLHNRIMTSQPITLQRTKEGELQNEGLKVSFSFCPDIARILLELTNKAVNGEELPRVLNLAGPEGISIKAFASEIGYCINKEVLFEESTQTRGFDLIADISKLNSLINPCFTPFSEAIKKSFCE